MSQMEYAACRGACRVVCFLPVDGPFRRVAPLCGLHSAPAVPEVHRSIPGRGRAIELPDAQLRIRPTAVWQGPDVVGMTRLPLPRTSAVRSTPPDCEEVGAISWHLVGLSGKFRAETLSRAGMASRLPAQADDCPRCGLFRLGVGRPPNGRWDWIVWNPNLEARYGGAASREAAMRPAARRYLRMRWFMIR